MDNSTIKFLEHCKDMLKKTYENYSSTDEYVDCNKLLSNEEFQKARLILRELSEKMDKSFESVIDNNRTVEEFCDQFHHEYYMTSFYNGNISSIISNIFNSYINYLEDNRYEVKLIEIECELPKALTFESIKKDFSKCQNRIEIGEYSGAITSARSLIEGVCKEILMLNGIDTINEKPNIPSLFKKVRNVLNLDPSNDQLEKPLKQVITGLNHVVTGLNEIRNLSGDGHTVVRKPSKHHAILTVNAAKTIVSFLFQSYEYQKEKGILQKNTNEVNNKTL